MDKLFGALEYLWTKRTAQLDNFIFRLHYRFTVVALIVFALLVTGQQHIGKPIVCSLPDKTFAQEFVDTYCWTHITYSVEEAWKKEVGNDVLYPGVDNSANSQINYHSYYQWVCFVLLLQAILFYVPHYFWQSLEGGLTENMLVGLNLPLLSKEDRDTKRTMLVDYLLVNWNRTDLKFLWYIVAEAMNLVNVVGQMYLLNHFLNGHFTSYGSDVLTFSEWNWKLGYDPMIRVFPRLAKCHLYKSGSSGSIAKQDYLCLLPVNIVNEKIYVFLWFWFVFLSGLTILVLVYHTMIVVLPGLRRLDLSCRARLSDRASQEAVLGSCKMGDWMTIRLLCKNLESLHFRDLMRDLASKMQDKIVDA